MWTRSRLATASLVEASKVWAASQGGGKGAEGNSARGGVDVVGIELARLDPRQEPLGAGEVLAPAGARVRQRARHPELVRSIDAILVETTGRSYGRVFAAEPVIRILER